MGDKIAQFVISLDGDGDGLRSALSGIKTQFRSDVAELVAISNKADLFSAISDNIPKIAAAVDKAKTQIADLNAQIQKIQDAGGKAPKELTDALAAAEKAAKSATSELNRQQQQLATLQTSLQRAGVDTKNLTAEQARLAAASKQAATDAQNLAARQALGLTTLKDIQPEIARLNTAYGTLQKSGTLSATETAAAQQILQQKMGELRGEVSKVPSAFAGATTAATSFFTSSIAKALAVGSIIGTVVAGYKAAIDASREYEQDLARIGSVTSLTKDQLNGLGLGARALAQEIGIGLDDALKGLYELIRSGVPPENALTVLKVGAEAAKAAFTDTATGVKAANLLVSAFGADVGDLAGDFDILVQAQGRGGATLKEFADNAGPLLNVARAAGIGIQDLTATLSVMVNASGDAASSIGDLQKIITKLGEPETRANLRQLGIDTTTLVSTFQGIAASGKTVDQILALGVASTKSAAGVASLTNNTDQLAGSLEAAANAAGKVKDVTEALYNTPEERSKRFNAAIHETAVTFGEAFGSGSKLQDILTSMIVAVNDLNAEYERNFNPTAAAAKQRLDEITESTKKASAAASEHTAKVSEQRAELTRLAEDLGKQIAAIEAGTARDIEDLNARADAQIAALDRSKSAELKTAADTLAIRTKLANDTFVVLTNNEKKISDATAAAITARLLLGKEANQADADFSAQLAKIRLDGIAQTLAGYQAYYKTLNEQEQAYLGKAQAVAEQRIAFNEGVEQRLFDIRTQGLSTFDQYLATVQRIDGLISLEREAAANGDIETAKKYADQAIQLSGTIKTATTNNGVVIVTELQKTTTQIGKIKEAQDILNGAFDTEGKSAKTGADDTKKQMDSVADKIKDLQTQYDDLKKTVAEGLKIRAVADEESITATAKKLDELTKPREVVITARFDTSAAASASFGTGDLPGLIPKAAGGYVGRPVVQGFAGGGPVFKSPSWSKVPGIGSGDTVPALLQNGSFVMRKAASMQLGDAFMGSLARGYAGGGLIGNFFGPGLGGNFFGGSNIFNGRAALSGAGSDGLRGTAYTLFNDLFEILARNVRVPAPSGELDYRQYLQNVYDLINGDLDRGDTTEAQTLYDSIAKIKDSIRVAAEQANLWHVPLVYGTNAVFGEDFLLTTEQLAAIAAKQGKQLPGFGPALAAAAKARQGRGFGFAGGGSVGTADTVPAMLTPGEWVLNPPAVQQVMKLFGGGFLDDLNKHGTLGLRHLTLAPPPPMPKHYAMGGPVGNVPVPSSQAATGGDLHVHINGAQFDLNNQADVRRLLAQIDDIRRRTGKGAL